MPSYDTIIIGLGAAGSAAAYHLAKRGQRVLGLDRYTPPHTQGSSHGGSRIIRKAYFEGEQYVPLLERSYELWRALEEISGRHLLHLTGGLMIGPEGSAIVEGSQKSAETHGLPHEVLSAAQVQARFPAFHLPEGHVALWEPDAGLLDPETCIRTHLERAREHGATLRFEEPASGWHVETGGVRVTTSQGHYATDRLAVCAGGWIGDLLPDLSMPLQVERQMNGWFRPKANADHFAPEQCPIYVWEYAPDHVLYGFPDLGEGVKAGLHHDGKLVDHPDDLQRETTPEDEAALRQQLRRLLPDVDGPLVHAATCFYTDTPDQHYLIDRHPEHEQVVLAGGFSGHGFKVSSAVGALLADLLLDGTVDLDLEPFRRAR